MKDIGGSGAGGEAGLAAGLLAAGSDPELIGRLLDQLEIGFCHYDADDRVVHWNATYMVFFPELAGFIRRGLPYVEELIRFFERNLPESELPHLMQHAMAGVARHRSQQVPFVFQQKTGRWLKVASLPIVDGGRLRLWRDVTVEQAGPAQPTTAQALAAIDVGYAVFDSAGRFVSANKRYQELFPSIGELVRIGVPYADHLARIAAELLPADAAALQVRATRPAPDRQPAGRPLRLGRRAGGWLQLEERYGEDGTLVSIWVDATRQAEAEARIVRLERYLQDAVEAIPHGLLLFDGEERLALANRRLAQLDSDLAAAMVEAAPLEAYACWRAALPESAGLEGQLERLRALAANEEVRLPDGRWLAIESFRTPSRDLLLLLTDVSREKAAERELQQQREAMHQSEKLTALGSLLAGVAHELNNPLSIVVGRAALLESMATDPLVVTQARTIGSAADRCARIVKTFLELARQRPPSRRDVTVNALVDDTLTLMSYGLKAAGVAVTTDLAPDLPLLRADPDQLSQVLINLIVNAQHALVQRPEPRRLGLATRHDAAGGMVEIRIADNGPGIPDEVRSRIFEPFFTTKPMGEGTGLGLSLSLGRVQSHGGSIEIESTPGSGGATFIVRLPVGPAVATAVAADVPAPPPVRRHRILVVDDEPEIAGLLGDILLADGHDVVLAATGREALERMAREPVDLIVSDLMMPDLAGYDLRRALEARAGTKVPPFVFVTGDTLRMHGPSPPGTGAPIIEKPFQPGEVRRIVRLRLEEVGAD